MEDRIPVVIHVLNRCSCFYSGIAFKFAVKDYYPDLKGMVATDVIDQASADLLNSLLHDNKVLPVMLNSIAALQNAQTTIADVYGIDENDLSDDDRGFLLAYMIYQETIFDNFPMDDDYDGYDDDTYMEDLELYASSLVYVIYLLFLILSKGEADLHLPLNASPFYLDMKNDHYFDGKHGFAIDIIKDLGTFLANQHLYILDCIVK